MKLKTIITILLALRQRTEKANRKAEIRTKKNVPICTQKGT